MGNWLAAAFDMLGTDKMTECHQTILQLALIIGTLISGWRVYWSGNAIAISLIKST